MKTNNFKKRLVGCLMINNMRMSIKAESKIQMKEFKLKQCSKMMELNAEKDMFNSRLNRSLPINKIPNVWLIYSTLKGEK